MWEPKAIDKYLFYMEIEYVIKIYEHMLWDVETLLDPNHPNYHPLHYPNHPDHPLRKWRRGLSTNEDKIKPNVHFTTFLFSAVAQNSTMNIFFCLP